MLYWWWGCVIQREQGRVTEAAGKRGSQAHGEAVWQRDCILRERGRVRGEAGPWEGTCGRPKMGRVNFHLESVLEHTTAPVSEQTTAPGRRAPSWIVHTGTRMPRSIDTWPAYVL